MRSLTASALTAMTAAAAVMVSAATANAACKKMGFLVNDYGKDGPTKDAQDLLDKHIAEWAAQNGIKNYTVGKKDVKCELYIDVILFDEHTCTASANVCWDEPGKEKPAKSAKKKEQDSSDTAKAAESDDKSSESKPSEEAPKTAAGATTETKSETAPAGAIETGRLPPHRRPLRLHPNLKCRPSVPASLPKSHPSLRPNRSLEPPRPTRRKIARLARGALFHCAQLDPFEAVSRSSRSRCRSSVKSLTAATPASATAIPVAPAIRNKIIT
jgi:hypothetical protein